jgi:hypothetical protein
VPAGKQQAACFQHFDFGARIASQGVRFLSVAHGYGEGMIVRDVSTNAGGTSAGSRWLLLEIIGTGRRPTSSERMYLLSEH